MHPRAVFSLSGMPHADAAALFLNAENLSLILPPIRFHARSMVRATLEVFFFESPEFAFDQIMQKQNRLAETAVAAWLG